MKQKWQLFIKNSRVIWSVLLWIISAPHLLTLSSIYMHFYACATSVDPDQPAHLYHLIWICTGRILVRNNLMNQKGCAG
jgi:hypothetical protein